MIQSKAKNTAHWNSLVSVKSFQSSILRQPHDSYAKSTIKAVFLPERSCNHRGNLKKNNLSVSQMIVERGRVWAHVGLLCRRACRRQKETKKKKKRLRCDGVHHSEDPRVVWWDRVRLQRIHFRCGVLTYFLLHLQNKL
jgi:hypothetical protein